MKHAWVILTNSIMANFYSVSEENFQFDLIKRIFHPESRMKEAELVSDRPGHYKKTLNKIKGSYVEPTSHKDLEVEHFVKEICRELESGRISNAYNGIILVAEPHFYGLINKYSTPHVKKLIKFHISKDYTHYSEKDLKSKLKNLLSHELRLILIS